MSFLGSVQTALRISCALFWVQLQQAIATPQFVEVAATGVSAVPGAIVCPNFQAVQIVFDGYVASYEDSLQDALTHGQSQLLRGAPRSKPDPELYGCVLVAPGTPMKLEQGNVVPVVTVRLPDGRTVKGVTLPAMIARKPKEIGSKDITALNTWQPTFETGSATAKQNAGTSPKKILIELHAGMGSILSLDGVNTDNALVTFSRQIDDLFDDCKRNSSCVGTVSVLNSAAFSKIKSVAPPSKCYQNINECVSKLANEERRNVYDCKRTSSCVDDYSIGASVFYFSPDEKCDHHVNECVSELAKEDRGKVYKVSSVCSTRVITTELGPAGGGNTFQLWKLEPHDGFIETDWKDLKTGKLTGDCSACQTPHLVSALEVLCPKFAREPVNHEYEAAAENGAGRAPEAERMTDGQLRSLVDKSTASINQRLQERPWLTGLMRALEVNPGGGPIQPLSPAETKCHEMIERQSHECADSSRWQNARCTPAAIQHDLGLCEEDLRQEWLAQHASDIFSARGGGTTAK